MNINLDKHDGGLPKVVREWADITNPLAEFEIDDARSECLADLNDSGKKFSTIADIIEKNVEKL